MAQTKLTLDEAKRRWDVYEANDRHIARSSQALKLPESTFRTWLRAFRLDLKAAGFDPHSDVIPESYFTTPAEAPVTPAAPPQDKDAVAEARKEQERKRLRKERDDALARAIAAEDLRAGVFGLLDDPQEPISFQPDPGSSDPSAETIVVFLSDLHWGEVIDFEAMDGINSYNLEIARTRLERTFQAILDLATKHWNGPAPARLILILGGDMISGEIHQELMKTNAAVSMPAVRDVVTYLKAGIEMLCDYLDCPIDIISIPGNHGRSTFKPESKLAAETSYDTLVSEFLEMQLSKSDYRDRVTFFVPKSNDAVFSVYGWRFLATHGDKIGSRGGQGFVGVAATAARGMKKLMMDYAARGIHIDNIIMGHFHTALHLEEGYVNGCLSGPSEYSRDGRFRPQPASQLFLAVHPRRGVSQYRFIYPGAPEEGIIYERPEPPADPVRPRYRVQARRA